MTKRTEPPALAELEDSLSRLGEMMEWRRMGDRIRERRRIRDAVSTAEEIMKMQEHVSPELVAKRARLLELMRERQSKGDGDQT